MDTQNLWRTILTDIKPHVSMGVYQLLRSQTTLLSLENNIAVIGCHKPMLIPMIEGRYADLLKKTLDEYTKGDAKLQFIQKTIQNQSETDASEPLFQIPQQKQELFKLPERFNIDFTFENFAVSSSNQMAYAAATAVSKSPGTTYNPLFIYGGVGVGKTHLMQAIGHVVLKKNPNTRIIYCTGEEFTNEIIEAIGNKTTTKFKKKYRQVDMLLMDDIQFIAGKYAIQEEFFHTFNSIHQTKGQVVLTSDRPPEEINKLEERLRSRFEGGLTIDVGPADFELRTAILFIKAKRRKVELPMEFARMIASAVDNTRKLEGVFLRIITEAQLKNEPISKEIIEHVLGKTHSEAAKQSIEPNEVINTVAAYYDLKLAALKSEKRDKFLAVPRQIIYYLLRSELQIPLMDIGELLGGRDHTTIMHGVKKISELISTNEKIREDILGIKAKLFG